ncbi:MAG: roadblock/LC7 domain-containing protein [Cystobacterineae bacterium]|nr:roadblock/LC7 domain-containing protein [Cystobacterineae bacterium]
MANSLVMYEEEFSRIHGVCERLIRETHAKVVFLVDKNGQLITAAGQTQHVDTTSLASLTAGNVAAMGGLAKLIGENEFPHQFHEGTHESLYMTVIGGRVVLVVIFDNRTSLGLVRLRIKKASDEMMRILESVTTRAEYSGAASPFAEISDADIENLFQ